MKNAMKYYRIRYAKGHPAEGTEEMVTEPIARSLVSRNLAEAIDKLPPETKASETGTKKIAATKVTAKAV